MLTANPSAERTARIFFRKNSEHCVGPADWLFERFLISARAEQEKLVKIAVFSAFCAETLCRAFAFRANSHWHYNSPFCLRFKRPFYAIIQNNLSKSKNLCKKRRHKKGAAGLRTPSEGAVIIKYYFVD